MAAGWKTIIVNAIMLLIMFATQKGIEIPAELQGENVTNVVNAIWVVYAFGVALVNLILRFFTKTAVFKKE